MPQEQCRAETERATLSAEAIDQKLARAEQLRQAQLQTTVATAKGLNCYRHSEADSSCADCNGKWTPAARLELVRRCFSPRLPTLTAL